MKKRQADSLIEILIAFLIIIIAVSISILATSQVSKLKRQAVVKSHIYDLAYSYAEEQLATSTILYSGTDKKTVQIDDNNILLSFTVETTQTTITNFFSTSIQAATLTVTLNDEKDKDGEDKYKVQMLVIPQQP